MSKNFELSGKHVLYIGAFSGIGSSTIRILLSKRIKHLAAVDLEENVPLLQEWKQQYPETNIFYDKLDVTKKEMISAVYESVLDRMGHIDLVVNGFGIMTDQQLEATIQINLLGAIHSTLKALECMSTANGGKGGTIVNISSVVGLEPAAMLPVYSASKAGILAFTRAISDDVYANATGIRFLTVCPGPTATPLLDFPEKKTILDAAEVFIKRYPLMVCQSPESCAENMTSVIENAENGSVWIVDAGSSNEVEFPTLWKPKKNNE